MVVRIWMRIVVVLGVVALAGCGSGPAKPSTSGIEVTGTVSSSPSCPGPQRAGSPCPPKPVVGAPVELATKGAVVASTTTDATGRFHMTVPAGTYLIKARNVGYASEITQMITVTGRVDLVLVVDSGIR